MPNAFYIDSDNLNGNSFFLDEDESFHAFKVFRLNPGDSIFLLNGSGLAYKAVIEKYEDKIVSGRISKKVHLFGENDFTINIFPAILKRDRFEILLEKVTEMGVVNIYPVLTERCVKRQINIQRCKKIIVASAKQCQRSLFPVIHKPKSLQSYFEDSIKQSFAGVITSSKRISDFDLNNRFPVNIFIGPEGDFSFDEIQFLDSNGVQFFNLGKRKLRAETAIQACLGVFNELLG